LERHKERANICPCGCGQPIDEAWTPIDEGGPDYGTENYVCRAGTRLRAYRKELEESDAGLAVPPQRVPVVFPKR